MYNSIIEIIKNYDKIALFGHVRPDGDCIGAQIGLKNMIKNTYGIDCVIVGENSESLKFLGSMDEVDDSYFENALGIILDVSNYNRISDQRFKLCKKTLRIDHHPHEDEFDYEFEDTKKIATCEIVTKFLDYGFSIDKLGADALYTGILTDSGSFRYKNVSSNTFLMASKLLDKGVIPDEICNELFVDTYESLKFKGYVLLNFKTTDDGFSYMCIKNEDLERFNISYEEASYTVSLMNSLNKTITYALFIENNDQIRIRLRSKGPRIDLLANEYNGGGHMMASGATLPSWDKLDEFIEKIDSINKEYKKTAL